MNRLLLILALSALFYSCNTGESDTDPELRTSTSGIPAPQLISYSIIGQYAHDTSAYTQGLALFNGKLLESTGDYENSSLRITDWKTGSVEKKHMMGSREIFGEGITVLNNKIYQLTWESNIVYVYDVKDITKPIQTLKWPYDGWGITNNGTDLIISDGSANLYFVDPANLRVKNTISVKTNIGAVDNLNELEYIDGHIYANVYTTNDIVKVDPESGFVKGYIRLENLLAKNEITSRTDFLNGIAYDSTTKHILVTGKRWPKLFEIRLN